MDYGLIGGNLGHSYSKDIHEMLADYTYDLCPLTKEEFVPFMEQHAFRAINVTIPYKQDVIPYLDSLDDNAKAIGAVNTIVNKDGRLEGTCQQALEDVPRSQRDAGLAMGLTRWETTIHVLLPAAMPAIVTGIVLSAGRVFGEAAALIFTAGQSAPVLDFTCFDLSSPSCPWNIFRPAETLAVHIWKINSEGVVPDLEAISNGTAAVLMVCILAFNLIARFVGKLLERRLTSE